VRAVVPYGNSNADLNQFTGYLLRRAFVKAAGAARECIPETAHVRQVAVMVILRERGAISQRTLSDLTHVNPTLMVKLVDELEKKAWVARDRNPDDRRSYALRLTELGLSALAELESDLDRGEAEFTAPLTETERGRLKELLCVLLADDEALSVAELAERTGYLVTHAHRMLREWAEAELEGLDLHPRDFGVLATLSADEPCSQTQLAVRLGVTPAAVLMFLDELEPKGLVARLRRSDDRRVHDISLTDEGRQRLKAAQRAAARLQGRAVARLGEEGDAELRALLAKLLEPLDAHPAPQHAADPQTAAQQHATQQTATQH
jgi:DNA-binding MarR family transcriptional regulator